MNGKADVRNGDISEILEPSQQFVMDYGSREYQVRSVNVSTNVDWKSGILNFDTMP